MPFKSNADEISLIGNEQSVLARVFLVEKAFSTDRAISYGNLILRCPKTRRKVGGIRNEPGRTRVAQATFAKRKF